MVFHPCDFKVSNGNDEPLQLDVYAPPETLVLDSELGLGHSLVLDTEGISVVFYPHPQNQVTNIVLDLICINKNTLTRFPLYVIVSCSVQKGSSSQYFRTSDYSFQVQGMELEKWKVILLNEEPHHPTFKIVYQNSETAQQ